MTENALYTSVTYAEMLVSALARYPDRLALVYRDQRVSYGSLADSVSRVCQALAALGLQPGDCLAQLSGNRPEAVAVQFACYVLGLRYVPLHPLGAADDHAFILNDAGAAALVYEEQQFEEVARRIAAQAPGLRQVLSHGRGGRGEDLFAAAATYPAEPLKPRAAPDGIVAQLYTGGTSGRSKGLTLSSRAMVMNVFLTLSDWEWPGEIRFLCATPITHASGCMLVPILLRGGTVVLQSGFNAADFLHAVAAHRITATFLVPTMIYLLLEQQRIKKVDTSSLETVIYGGAPISPARLAEAIDAFGPVFMQIYSQSEAPNCATVLRRHEHVGGDLARLSSCGRPMAGIKVELLDEAATPVAVGEVGEICFRGPSIMNGYWQRPEETAETLRDGWLHTGDMAYRDADGFIFIVDRRKDMIVSGGFNVFPREVEDVLTTHPAVAAAAVIGVPDEKWGEAVKAIVVLRPGAATESGELIAHVKARKGAVAAPKSVDFVSAIPLTALGKPDKKVLRAKYWGGQGRQVH
jgi:fatty-acyl-CoA synthase